MTWTHSAVRIHNLPLVLAGPILRRTDVDVCFNGNIGVTQLKV